MTPLPPRMRLLGAFFRLFPTISVANMSLEQIDQVQNMVFRRNPATDLLLGGLRKGVKVAERTIDGPAAPLLLRIYTPERAASGPRPLIVYFHGGGWVLGSVHNDDWICSTAARDVDAVVVSVNYRLAPRHRFPAAVEDCFAALLWSSENAASLDADAARIAVMGESAGANLATVMCLLAKERGGPRTSHQALLYPPTDLARPAEFYLAQPDEMILSKADMKAFDGHYLGPDADRMDWRISPLHAAQHAGLPPAIIVVAGHDPLYDDGVSYAQRLAESGVPVILKEYPAMPHGFASFPHFNRETKLAFAEITQAQRTAFQSPGISMERRRSPQGGSD